MIELRWVVPEGTFIPGKEYPKLQFRDLTKVLIEEDIKKCGNAGWRDVPIVVLPNGTELTGTP